MKMRKMKMPKLSVVRFEESDVICASSRTYIPKTVSIENFDDGIASNGVIKMDGQTYTYSPHDGERSIFNTFLFNPNYSSRYWFETEAGRTPFGDLQRAEGNNPYSGTNGPIDGVYHWNEASGTYDWYSNQ